MKSKYDWAAIQQAYDTEKLSWRDIHARFGANLTRIQEAAKAGLFKSRSREEAAILRRGKKHKRHKQPKPREGQGEARLAGLDWTGIQASYDGGNTWAEVTRKHSITFYTLNWGVKNGRFVTRSKREAKRLRADRVGGQLHTQETKDKISAIRKAYLDANPDKVPYKMNHSSKPSNPEVTVDAALKRHGITGWVYNYTAGRYSYDFGFEAEKLDVEIDGNTHTLATVIASDARRDEWTQGRGWAVLRITAKEVRHDVDACIEKIKQALQQRRREMSAPKRAAVKSRGR